MINLLFFISIVNAMLEPSLDSAVPFYKYTDSQFPSGQARKLDLLHQTQNVTTEFQLKVAYDGREFDVLHETVFREIQVTEQAKVKRKTDLKLLPEMGSRRLQWLEKHATVKILSLKGAWARVQLNEKNISGFVLMTDLEAEMSDTSVFSNLTETVMRKSADASSPITVRLFPRTRLSLVKIEGAFGLFQTQTQKGYVHLSDVIGRADFADLGWHQKDRKWYEVSFRNGAHLSVRGKIDRLSLSDFTAFKSKKNRGVITQTQKELQMGSRVEILEAIAHRWNESYVKGHGLVWWKTDLKEKKQKPQKIWTTSEILKKNLKGMSFDKKSKMGLASAGGIFKTLDGKNWEQVEFFGNQDWPVCLHPSGVWFVGSYRSTDLGESFQPSLKWSEIVKDLQMNHQNRKMPLFRILDVKAVSSSAVEIKIDTGIKTALFRADAIVNDWKLIK